MEAYGSESKPISKACEAREAHGTVTLLAQLACGRRRSDLLVVASQHCGSVASQIPFQQDGQLVHSFLVERFRPEYHGLIDSVQDTH